MVADELPPIFGHRGVLPLPWVRVAGCMRWHHKGAQRSQNVQQRHNHRFGAPNAGQAALTQWLRRTLKTAAHETGHMFSIKHCIHYECNMCGCNSQAESDRRPLALCPECMSKVAWASRCDPEARYRKLADFCHEHGLDGEAAIYHKLIGALTK